MAAASVCRSPGRTGMLFHSPADATGVKRDALKALCRTAAEDALSGGLSLVQSLELPEAEADAEILQAAGFERLAELVYMRAATGGVSETARGDVSWRRCGEFTERELAAVISQTYVGSLDCPGLSGVRDVADVIRGHKASGVFSPETWWIVDRGGEAAGCVLVNDSSARPSSEIVYLGVVRSHRGAGIGEALVRRAAAGARKRGREALTLAVDAANAPARQVYEAIGFRPTERRVSWIMTARQAGVEGPATAES